MFIRLGHKMEEEYMEFERVDDYLEFERVDDYLEFEQ
jgi:hypothetical protein